MRWFAVISHVLLSLCFSYNASAQEADDVIGEVAHYAVKTEDNLYSVARRFDVGIVELLAANPGVDPWQPKAGTHLLVPGQHVLPPAQREGIVINLPELRLFFYAPDGQVWTFPIGIGREGWRTPTGKTKVMRKRKDPVWTPPPSIREENPELPEAIEAGPDNPLGQYALDLGMYGILIHGTNRPYGIGKRSSHGCIRLYPEDIAILFDLVQEDTPVTIIDAPYKLGWSKGSLYLEVTPTQQEADLIADYRRPVPSHMVEIYETVGDFAGEYMLIDWYAVEQAAARRNGIPVIIGKRSHGEGTPP